MSPMIVTVSTERERDLVATGAGDTPMGKNLDLAKVIAQGSKKMPAFAAKLTGAQIKQLVIHPTIRQAAAGSGTPSR